MASRFELVRFPNDAALADDVATRWLNALRARRSPHPFTVALSGGRITRQFFASIVRHCSAHPQTLTNAEFFWADERCVPPDHAESNFAMAQKLLLAPLAVPPSRIHRIRGEAKPADAVAEVEAQLRRIAPANNHGIPVLDIVFLGMGEDGHVASLFPEAMGQPEKPQEWYRAVVASKPPPERITMTYQTIAAAREVWAIVSGSGKEAALQRSLCDSGQTPLGRVIQLRPRTLIFTDVSVPNEVG